jgi:hypothetical protein
MTPSFPSRILHSAIVVTAFVAAPAAPARADDYVDRANQLYATIRPQKRSDLVLLPLVAKMDPPPRAADTPQKAMLLPAGSASWSAAQNWAKAQNQQAVLKALAQITAEENPVEAMAFGQPYGVDALAGTSDGIALIRAGLYTELGDPPMLAAARFLYLPALDRVACLVHVEATRLAADGQPADALKLLCDWLYFSRQMIDREMFQEARWGMESFLAVLERIRDVAYEDSRSAAAKLTPDHLAVTQQRLREEGGYLRLDRNQLPRGNRIAAEQVVARTFVARNGPDRATFAPTLARLGSTEHPLRIFSESARWDTMAALSADAADTSDQLTRVCDDWESRWQLSPFDPLLAVPSAYERMNKARYAAIAASLPDMGELFTLRQVMETQLVGTRNALGLVAFRINNRNLPLNLSALRPQYVKDIGSDPFNPVGRDRGGKPPLEYFVPIRDTKARFGPRDTPRPHEINVFTPGGEVNFQARVGEDQFVLYSVGPNGKKEWADNATGVPVKDSIGDLLLWPPVISLYRAELVSRGLLK